MSSTGETAADHGAEIIGYLRSEILPAIPAGIDGLTPANVEALRRRLHVLRHYCVSRGADDGVMKGLAACLSVTQGLWELLEQSAAMLEYLRRMESIRALDFAANAMGQTGDLLAGETGFQEIAVNAIGTCLGWISDTIWVDLARGDQQAVPRAHALRLQDELWDFLDETNPGGPDVTLAKAGELSGKMELLFSILTNDALPSGGRVMLLANMYLLVLGLHLTKVVRVVRREG